MQKKVKLDLDFDHFKLSGHALKTAGYKDNPVVLFNHDHEKVIGKCVGLEMNGNDWVVDIETKDDQYLEASFGPSIIIRKFHYEDGVKVIDEADLVEISALLESQNKNP